MNSLNASRQRWLDRAFNARLTWQIGGALALLALWQAIASNFVAGSLFFPSPSSVVDAWWQMILTGTLQDALSASFQLLVAGFGLASVLGILLGALMARYRKLDYVLGMYVKFFLASPQIAFVPVIVLLFGIGFWARVAALFMFTFFTINVTTYSGIKDTDVNLVEMARAFGASERQLFWKVMLPNAMPLLIAGLRLGVIQAVKGMIIVEMLITLNGLGYLTRYYSGAFATDFLYAVLLTIVILAIFISGVTQVAERRALWWSRLGSS